MDNLKYSTFIEISQWSQVAVLKQILSPRDTRNCKCSRHETSMDYRH